MYVYQVIKRSSTVVILGCYITIILEIPLFFFCIESTFQNSMSFSLVVVLVPHFDGTCLPVNCSERLLER